jgi:hypothetical protein
MNRFTMFAALALTVALISVRTSSAGVLADWTLTNNATGYVAGLPHDSVGGHDFQNSFGGAPTFGGSVGGTSSTSSKFDGTGGFYGTTAGTTTLPTDNFAVDVHAKVATLAQGDLFSSSGGSTGQLQIGEDSSGNWIAYVTNSGSNNSGTVIGTVPVSLNTNTELRVTDVAGVFTLYVNHVAAGPGVTPADSFVGFGAMHIAVAPGGGGPNFNGSLSDLTISTVPEPGSLVLFGLGAAGLFLAARRRKS